MKDLNKIFGGGYRILDKLPEGVSYEGANYWHSPDFFLEGEDGRLGAVFCSEDKESIESVDTSTNGCTRFRWGDL